MGAVSGHDDHLISALIFDLDGTLVETEELKAQAYALVSQELLGLPSPDWRAVALYQRLVGGTDELVAKAMVEELGLDGPLARRAPGAEPWRALHDLRMATYRRRVGTPRAIRGRAYNHTLSVLKAHHEAGLRVAVATSSFRDEGRRVLRALGVLGMLNAVVGRDQVSRPKPDPEGYLLAMRLLGVAPEAALIFEDSQTGLAAAVASGARWVCVATDLSREGLKSRADIDQRWVVYDPAQLNEVVRQRMA